MTTQLRLSNVAWHLLCRQSRARIQQGALSICIINFLKGRIPKIETASPEKPKRRGKMLASRWTMSFSLAAREGHENPADFFTVFLSYGLRSKYHARAQLLPGTNRIRQQRKVLMQPFLNGAIGMTRRRIDSW